VAKKHQSNRKVQRVLEGRESQFWQRLGKAVLVMSAIALSAELGGKAKHATKGRRS
jgi:hypothetical protein